MIRCAQCKKPIEGFHVVLAYETGSKQFCDPKCADLYVESKEQSGEPPAGSKRDLKADLEELKSLKEDDVHFMSIVCFIENNAEKWLEQGVVELERAIKAERLKDMLVKYNKFLVAEVLNKRERSEQLESLARELAEVLRLYEQWEAELIMDNSLWQSASGLPFITQEVWDELVAIQAERNGVLQDAKEALNAD